MNNTTTENRLTPIESLQVKLYQVIEQQAILQAEFNRLETVKGELAKELGTARKAEQDEKQAA